MDSPSSGSTNRPVLSEAPAETVEARHTSAEPNWVSLGDVVAIAGFREAVAADYAAFVAGGSRGEVVLIGDGRGVDHDGWLGRSLSLEESSRSTPADWGGHEPSSLILFLARRPTEDDRRGFADLLTVAKGWPIRFVGIVGTFRVHLDDPAAEEAERFAISLVRSYGIESRVAVFRPGLVLSTNSRVSRWLRRLAPLFPLAPRRLCTCFVEGAEFFAAIEAVRLNDDPHEGIGDGDFDPNGLVDPGPAGKAVCRRQRVYTMLGANLPWRLMLKRRCGAAAGQRVATAVAGLLSWLLVGQLAAIGAEFLAKRASWARPWSVRTLEPRSIGELLSLCHRANIGHVRVVGYNNGVNHFGHRYPGKTIVSTTRCRRTVHAGPGLLDADCGATIRDAREYLRERGEELYVVPNYSYVALGTSFFVPIHGSAVDYSTVADTICRVVLYDPDRDWIVAAERHDTAFRENVYNPQSRSVVLRLRLRTKPKSSYFVRTETRKSVGAEELLEALRDHDAANVEIRQAHASSDKVTISRYDSSLGDSPVPALESPRDTLGRLWDRLEENPVTSFLMHALSRHLAWHTELFFTPEEFEVFWRTHAQVPLRKIQLRYIRRDGMPHSPFREEDCVSADLFLFRHDKPAFDAYLGRTFASVRTNPGKHNS